MQHVPIGPAALGRRSFCWLGLMTILSPSLADARSTQPDWKKAETVRILMKDYAFEPAEISLQHGMPYELQLDNVGKELHEFTAPAFFKDALVRDRHALANGGIEVSVHPGMSARVFLVPLKPGHYKLTCADHDWLDMIGTIVVK
jgi:plastocyanin